MERPTGLFRCIFVCLATLTAAQNQGRLHLTGCQPIEDYIELDSCHCDVGEKFSFSFNTRMLRGLDEDHLPSVLALTFDHDLAGCEGNIRYTQQRTFVDFIVDKNCGVSMDSSDTELPALRTGSFNGNLLQAKLGFHYPNLQGKAEYVVAEVGCACPTEHEQEQYSTCEFDADQKLRFVKDVEIDCAQVSQAAAENNPDPDNCRIESNDCYGVEEGETPTKKIVKFNFALDDENCVGEARNIQQTGLGPFVKVDFQMEIENTLPGLLPLTYTTSWEYQAVCNRAPSWSQWSQFSSCQTPCGAGKRYRSRHCQNGLAGLPGCERSPDGITSVEEADCNRVSICPEVCPGETTQNGNSCECQEKPLLAVLVPERLISQDVFDKIDQKYIYFLGSEPHVTADFILSELSNTANINFLHRGSTDDTQYLLDYSPQISGDNLQQARASLNDGNSLTLTNFGLGSATYEKLVLPRIFYSSDASLEAAKVFKTASVVKDWYSDDKFVFKYQIEGMFLESNEHFTITGDMTEADWCRTTNEPTMPTHDQPEETCDVSCDVVKPYLRGTNCPKLDSIRDDCPDHCCEDPLPLCRKVVDGKQIELEYTTYSCSGCQVHVFTCEVGGPPQGRHQVLPATDEVLSQMDEGSQVECQSILDSCHACADNEMSWKEWGQCSSLCGQGQRVRERELKKDAECIPNLHNLSESESCVGSGFTSAIEVNATVEFKSTIAHQETIVPCSNFQCSDNSINRFFYEKDGACFYQDIKTDCSQCCVATRPTADDWANQECVSPAVCATGYKKFIGRGPCENHPFQQEFQQPCSKDTPEQCACPTEMNVLDSSNHCEAVDSHNSAPCLYYPTIDAWKKLVFACLPHDHQGHCDGFLPCSPPECTSGSRTSCCEEIDPENVNNANGDNCIQTVKICYDKEGNKIDSLCADCQRNICEGPNNKPGEHDPRNLRWCRDIGMVESCEESMGGELYCDGALPQCQDQQQRICSTTDDSDDPVKCRYNVTCDCDAYHCTDNSITIKGVDEDFLNRLKPRTNDLTKVYGENLNFYIGGGHAEAFRTEGCYHHYTKGMVDLTYEFGNIENKCGVEIDGSRLNATIWVDSADHSNPTYATATPFAQVVCHVTHEVKPLPGKNITSLMRFKPFEFIKVRKYEHDLSFDISTDPDFHELLEHRQLQNLVLVGDKMYARIRSNDVNDKDLKIKVVRCTVKKVNNQDLSLNFIENGCKNDQINEFDFTFGEDGYENGAGSEVRFEWTNFVWRGFTNVQGDQSTSGREEQQYSCDVEICGHDQICTPTCIQNIRHRRSPVAAQKPEDEEGVDFELEVFRTEAELKKRYQEILAEHISNTDAIDKMLSNAIVTLASAMCFISAIIGFLGLYKYFKKDKLESNLQARIFRRFPPRGAPPKYSAKSFTPQPTLTTVDQSTIDYAASTVDDFVVGQKNNNSV